MFDWLRNKKAPAEARPAPEPHAASAADPATLAAVIAAGDLARERGQVGEAIARFEDAHRLAPERIYPLFWLATLLQEQGDLARARDCIDKALALDAKDIGLLLRAGSIAVALHDPVAALEHFEQVARLDPEVPDLDALMADQYCTIGRVAEGVAAFDRAIARNPGSIVLQQNRLFVLNYSDLLSPEELAAEHFAWAARHEAPLQSLRRAFGGSRDPQRILRVGLVSPDLRDHAVAYFVERLLRGVDRRELRIECFDTSSFDEDFVTARLKPHASAWHRCGALDDEQLANAIRSVPIDILIDLSGHTMHNRLLCFARKPAPVQMTWLGYLATTGMSTMDYRITDAHMDPEGMTEGLHTEQLLRLPVQACFAPWADSPAVGTVPSLASSHVTYGAVNQWSKASAGTLDLWARLLKAAPESRIRIIAKGGHTAGLRQRIVGEFVRRGAAAKQIELSPFMETRAFLEFLNGIDVALDPFPYGGGTTTMHCLWMGVPVVTLQGRTALSRNAVGPLHAVGLADLVATTPDDYVRIASALGHDTARLTRLRAGLRSTMLASPLTDETAFGRAFGAACRQAWRRYCAAAP